MAPVKPLLSGTEKAGTSRRIVVTVVLVVAVAVVAVLYALTKGEQ